MKKGDNGLPVKPSAQPTLVRTQHLPPMNAQVTALRALLEGTVQETVGSACAGSGTAPAIASRNSPDRREHGLGMVLCYVAALRTDGRLRLPVPNVFPRRRPLASRDASRQGVFGVAAHG